MLAVPHRVVTHITSERERDPVQFKHTSKIANKFLPNKMGGECNLLFNIYGLYMSATSAINILTVLSRITNLTPYVVVIFYIQDIPGAIEYSTKALEIKPKCFEAYYARARAKRAIK